MILGDSIETAAATHWGHHVSSEQTNRFFGSYTAILLESSGETWGFRAIPKRYVSSSNACHVFSGLLIKCTPGCEQTFHEHKFGVIFPNRSLWVNWKLNVWQGCIQQIESGGINIAISKPPINSQHQPSCMHLDSLKITKAQNPWRIQLILVDASEIETTTCDVQYRYIKKMICKTVRK